MRVRAHPIVMRCCVAALIGAGLPAALAAQTVSGRARVAAAVEAIPGVRVTLLADSVREAGAVVTDTAGRYLLQAKRPGRYAIRFQRIGFKSITTAMVTLVADSTHKLDAELVPVVQRLGEVKVTGIATPVVDFMRGFERRRLRGMGRYLSRDDIEKRAAANTTDLIRGMLGMELMVDDRGELFAQSSRGERSLGRGGNGPCRALVYLDGLELTGEALDRVIRPSSVEAVESYSGAAGLPAEFRQGNASCGVIFIWTRSTSASP